MQENNNNSIIKLNVGGKSYYTKQNTLEASVYFETLLNGQMQTPVLTGDKNDEIFIDRDGEMFRHVLQYMRTGILFTKKENILKKIKLEAKYYGLKNLEDDVNLQLKELTQNKDTYMFTSSDKLIEQHLKKAKISGAKYDHKSKLLQVVESLDTVEKRTKCYLDHSGEAVENRYTCLHENKKTNDLHEKRVIVRRYIA